MTQQQKDDWTERIESLDGPPVDGIREKAIQEYGNDLHSFGGQRDGFVKGYLAAMKEYEQELSLLQSKIDELKEDLANKEAGVPWMSKAKPPFGFNCAGEVIDANGNKLTP